MTPDPMETQVIKAREEDPRCERCDRILEEYAVGDPLLCGCDWPDIKDAEDRE